MAPEYLRQRIDQLLDDAEEALAQSDWVTVIDCTNVVLELEPNNVTAQTLQYTMELALVRSPAASPDPGVGESHTTSPLPAHSIRQEAEELLAQCFSRFVAESFSGSHEWDDFLVISHGAYFVQFSGPSEGPISDLEMTCEVVSKQVKPGILSEFQASQLRELGFDEPETCQVESNFARDFDSTGPESIAEIARITSTIFYDVFRLEPKSRLRFQLSLQGLQASMFCANCGQALIREPEPMEFGLTFKQCVLYFRVITTFVRFLVEQPGLVPILGFTYVISLVTFVMVRDNPSVTTLILGGIVAGIGVGALLLFYRLMDTYMAKSKQMRKFLLYVQASTKYFEEIQAAETIRHESEARRVRQDTEAERIRRNAERKLLDHWLELSGLAFEQEEPTSFANGRYEVKPFLEEGGKKQTYLAQDTFLDREVAFALIKTEGMDEVSRAPAITREARPWASSAPILASSLGSSLVKKRTSRPKLVTELMGGGLGNPEPGMCCKLAGKTVVY